MKQLIRYILVTGLLLFAIPASAATDCPRIISQSPYITHTLSWLGLEQCLVGASRYDHLDLPSTGGVLDPDIEIITSLKPDILLTSDWTSADSLEKLTAAGIRSYRLHGFQSMRQIEQNLQTIASAMQWPELDGKVEQFAHDWRSAAKQLDARETKALLLSSCSGNPYSFGRETWLYDLFTTAGFEVVETHKNIRHLQAGNDIEDITNLLDRYKPDVLFIFEHSAKKSCNMLIPKVPLRIVTLKGELYLHPAPILLKGLEHLQTRQAEWKTSKDNHD